MSHNANKPTPGASRAAIEIAGGDAPDPAASGRPAFDSRGTTVWEWKTATGVFSRDASTTRVQKLEAPELSLEKTIVTKKPEIEEPQVNVAPCGGFNPYDRAVVVKTESAARPVALKLPPTQPVVLAPRRPAAFFERLRAWLTGE